MVDDDDVGEASFKRSGSVPFNWEIRPGIPKTRDPTSDDVPSLLLQPPKKLHPLRLKQLPPSSSPSSSPKPSAVSPFAPPPPYFKAKPPSASGPPSPYWRSSSAQASGSALSRWRLLRSLIGMKKSKSRDVKKNGEDSPSSESDDFYDSGTTFTPSEGSSRGSVATSLSSSQLSSSSSSSSLKSNESDLSSSERKAIVLMARGHLF